MPRDIESIISQMSPEQLGGFSQRLTQAMGSLSSQQRSAVLSRIQGIPQLGQATTSLAGQQLQSPSQQWDAPMPAYNALSWAQGIPAYMRGYTNPWATPEGIAAWTGFEGTPTAGKLGTGGYGYMPTYGEYQSAYPSATVSPESYYSGQGAYEIAAHYDPQYARWAQLTASAGAGGRDIPASILSLKAQGNVAEASRQLAEFLSPIGEGMKAWLQTPTGKGFLKAFEPSGKYVRPAPAKPKAPSTPQVSGQSLGYSGGWNAPSFGGVGGWGASYGWGGY